MVNENLKVIVENKKPIETVYELKDEYKIPSFEEFMKDYKADEKVNYDDLDSSDVGTAKSYGPGNNTSSEGVAKGTVGVVGGIGIGVLGIVCPPVGIGAAATVGAMGAGAKAVNHFVPEDSKVKEVLDVVGDSYEIAGAIGGSTTSVKQAASRALIKK